MNVPFVDLRPQHRALGDELRAAFARILESASFILGSEVERFEEAFARYLGCRYVVSVSSGTAALHLALLGLGIGPGDEVVTTPHTFIATTEAITAVGARPVFADIDPVSYTLDPGRVEAAITRNTKAIVPVHLYGQPADMDPLLSTAKRHGIAVVEDACQAHGAEYRSRKVGTLGDAGCFSFFPSKNLGCCGEGGAVATNNAALAERVSMLRAHGSRRKYEHRFPGFNLRMEALQGAVLSAKLKHLDSWNELRRAIATRYKLRLAEAGVVLPTEMPYARHVYHLYVVQSPERDALRGHLAAWGIETGLHYPVPVHLQEAYRHLGYREEDFPVTESVTRHIVSLPMFSEMTHEAVDYVASAIEDFHRLRPIRAVRPHPTAVGQ